MKTYQFRGILCVTAVAIAGWMSSGNAEDFPPNSYACHVTTSTAIPALSLVQAKDTTEAVAIAQRNKAVTFDGVSVMVATVVQCVLPPNEKFDNLTFQKNFEKMEL